MLLTYVNDRRYFLFSEAFVNIIIYGDAMKFSKTKVLNLILTATLSIFLSSKLSAKDSSRLNAENLEEALFQALRMPAKRSDSTLENLRSLLKRNEKVIGISFEHPKIPHVPSRKILPTAQDLYKNFVRNRLISNKTDAEKRREGLVQEWEGMYQSLRLDAEILSALPAKKRAYEVGLREFTVLLNEAKVKLRTPSEKCDEQEAVFKMGIRRSKEGLEKFIPWVKDHAPVSRVEKVSYNDWIKEAAGKEVKYKHRVK